MKSCCIVLNSSNFVDLFVGTNIMFIIKFSLFRKETFKYKITVKRGYSTAADMYAYKGVIPVCTCNKILFLNKCVSKCNYM